MTCPQHEIYCWNLLPSKFLECVDNFFSSLAIKLHTAGKTFFVLTYNLFPTHYRDKAIFITKMSTKIKKKWKKKWKKALMDVSIDLIWENQKHCVQSAKDWLADAGVEVVIQWFIWWWRKMVIYWRVLEAAADLASGRGLLTQRVQRTCSAW
jgi:hypothetical protein